MIEQLWYTWSDRGFGATQMSPRVRAASKGLMDIEGARFRRLDPYLRYKLPPGVDPRTTTTHNAPACLAFVDTGYERAIMQKVHANWSEAKPAGNYFIHLLAGLPASFSAAEAILLWHADLWMTSDASLSREQRELPTLPLSALQGSGFDKLDFMEVKDMLAPIIKAYLLLQQGMARKLYIAAPAQHMAAFILGLTLCMPKGWIKSLTFSTYERLFFSAPGQIIGTQYASSSDTRGGNRQDVLREYYTGQTLAINCYTGKCSPSLLANNEAMDFFAMHAAQSLVSENLTMLQRIQENVEKMQGLDVDAFLTVAKQEILKGDTTPFPSRDEEHSIPPQHEESHRKQEVTGILNQPESAATSLTDAHFQHALLDLVIGNAIWWSTVGRGAVTRLHRQADKKMLNALDTFAHRVTNAIDFALSSEDEENIPPLLELLFSLVETPDSPQRMSSISLALLRHLSVNSKALPFMIVHQDIHCMLLSHWACIASSIDDTLIRPLLRISWTELGDMLQLDLPEKWYSMALDNCVEQLSMRKEVLSAFAAFVSGLPTETREKVLEMVAPLLAARIESELDLGGVLFSTSTVLIQQECIKLLFQMVSAISDEYKRYHVESRLVPYIRVILQLELFYDLSLSEQEQLKSRLFDELLQHGDKGALMKLNGVAEMWPHRVRTAWSNYWSQLPSGGKSMRLQKSVRVQ